MTAPPPALEVHGMSKRFGALVALDDVSLALAPGSFHAILGENGAGKSTFVKCVMGYERPDAGRVLIDGQPRAIAGTRGAGGLEIDALRVRDDQGLPAVRAVSLRVAAGEIVGVAGVSGNGQRELVEALAGQRERAAGGVRVGGLPFTPTRAAIRRQRVRVLPEEPLATACVRGMTVAENLAFRTFDEPRHTVAGALVRRGRLRAEAMALIERFRIRAQGPDARLETLSGGNVQRAVLARELSGDPAVLVVQNPCAGLDLAATAETRGRIMAARNAGAAVLLVSEDLDELLELADRIVVMANGRLVYETTREAADVHTIGHHMVSEGSAR